MTIKSLAGAAVCVHLHMMPNQALSQSQQSVPLSWHPLFCSSVMYLLMLFFQSVFGYAAGCCDSCATAEPTSVCDEENFVFLMRKVLCL